MNTFKRCFQSFLCIIFAIAMLFLIAGCSGGCANKKPTTVVLQTSQVTHVGVTTAIRTWDTYVAQQVAEIRVSETSTNAVDLKAAAERKAKLVEQAKQVRDAYAKYRASQTAALSIAAEVAKIPPGDTNAPAGQDKLDAALAIANVALSEVGILLTAFGVEVK